MTKAALFYLVTGTAEAFLLERELCAISLPKFEVDMTKLRLRLTASCYCLESEGLGRTPWKEIEDNNSAFLKSYCIPDGSFTLRDPSYMKEADVNAFLQLWNRLQMRGKQYPLSFKGTPHPAKPDRHSAKVAMDKLQDDTVQDGEEALSDGEESQEFTLWLDAPSTVVDKTRKEKRWYLRNLDEDENYQLLIQVLARSLVRPFIATAMWTPR